MTRLIAGMIVIGLIGALASGCTPVSPGDLPGEDTLAIFHNGSGPMCLEALAWLETMQAEHPDLVVEEYLTTNVANLATLSELKSQYGQSQGLSTTFGYLPIIFFAGQAFSGFNEDVQTALGALIEVAEAPSS